MLETHVCGEPTTSCTVNVKDGERRVNIVEIKCEPDGELGRIKEFVVQEENEKTEEKMRFYET